MYSMCVCVYVYMYCLPTLSPDADGCTVCKEVFKVGESLKKLPCDHLFHDNCVIKWLKQVCAYIV